MLDGRAVDGIHRADVAQGDRLLVFYASSYGNTRRLAEEIGRGAEAAGARVTLVHRDAAMHKGNPTYPRPITPTLARFDRIRSRSVVAIILSPRFGTGIEDA